MKIRALVLVILAISIAPSTSMADPPTTLSEDIYQRIAVVERVPPAQRNNAQRIQLGRDYRSTGRLEDALAQAQAALAKQPDDGDALLLLGDLQFQRAEYTPGALLLSMGFAAAFSVASLIISIPLIWVWWLVATGGNPSATSA